MPVHLDWRQKLIVAKQTVISNLPGEDSIMANISLKEMTKKALKLETERRVRSFNDYRKYIAAIQTIISQIPSSDRSEFAENGNVNGTVKHWLNDDNNKGSKVSLIFEKGSTVINQKYMPTTKLKRVEISNCNGEVGVIWHK